MIQSTRMQRDLKNKEEQVELSNYSIIHSRTAGNAAHIQFINKPFSISHGHVLHLHMPIPRHFNPNYY